MSRGSSTSSGSAGSGGGATATSQGETVDQLVEQAGRAKRRPRAASTLAPLALTCPGLDNLLGLRPEGNWLWLNV